MAEIVAGPVIDELVDLLLEEAKLFKGVHKNVEWLKNELESIKCFLKDAEARSRKGGDTNEGVKTWVKKVREEAIHIEDVSHEYLRHVAPCRHESGFVGFLKKIGHVVKHLKARYNIASEVRDIKASLHEINERSKRYGFCVSLEDGSGGTRTTIVKQYDTRLDSRFIEEDDVVGIKSTGDNLISMLVDGESRRRVISVGNNFQV